MRKASGISGYSCKKAAQSCPSLRRWRKQSDRLSAAPVRAVPRSRTAPLRPEVAEVHVVPQQNFSQIQIIRAGFQGREVFLLRPAVQRDRDARLAQLGSNLIGCLRPVRAVGAVEQRQREARALPGQARVGQQLLGRLQVPRLDRRCAQQGKSGWTGRLEGCAEVLSEVSIR